MRRVTGVPCTDKRQTLAGKKMIDEEDDRELRAEVARESAEILARAAELSSYSGCSSS